MPFLPPIKSFLCLGRPYLVDSGEKYQNKVRRDTGRGLVFF